MFSTSELLLSMMPARFTDKWIFLGLLVAIAVYVSLSVRHIACPGINYDEVNWANIALGEVDDSWISQRVGNIPFLLALPYVGALKGHLMRVIFWLFGMSVASIRVPGIVIGAASVVLIFFTARKVLGNSKIAVAAAWLLAINPEFIQRTRVDLGPAAIDLLCKEAALLILIHLTEGLSVTGVLGALVICALGLWNKLTFIWYINAFVVAGLCLYRREWFKLNRRQAVASALAIVGVAAFLIYTGWVYFHWNLGNVDERQNVTWMERAGSFAGQLRMELAGVSSINFSFEPYEPVGSYIWPVVKCAFLLAGLFWMLRKERRSGAKLFVVISAAVTLAEVGLTKAASWPWHSFAIEPFQSLVFVAGLYFAVTVFGRYRALAFGLIVASVTFNSGVVMAHFNDVVCKGRAMTNEAGPTFWRASMAIYPLIDFAKLHPNDQLVCLDWGLRTQLMVLGTNPSRTIDYDKASLLLPHYLDTPDVFFVVHTPDATALPNGRESLYRFSKLSGKKLEVVKVIDDGSRPAIKILRATPETTKPL